MRTVSIGGIVGTGIRLTGLAAEEDGGLRGLVPMVRHGADDLVSNS